MEANKDVMGLEDSKEALESFIERYMRLERRTERPKNIYSILMGPKEGKYQYTLRYFLDPAQPHGFKDKILRAFLDSVGERAGGLFAIISSELRSQHIELQTEVVRKEEDDRRIDLIIAGGYPSDEQPIWAVFIELKVGASEGIEQTLTYAEADSWNFDWFGNRLEVCKLEAAAYVYIRKKIDREAQSPHFISMSWADLVDIFLEEINEGIFDHPHRSVIQFLDFIRSLKEVEKMEDGSKKRDLELMTERLSLYFEQKELIEKVDQANRQFQQDFNEMAYLLNENWDTELDQIYDFAGSYWSFYHPDDIYGGLYEGIYPDYWRQLPIEGDIRLQIFFSHSTTPDSIRERTLSFRLRVPTHRNVHRKAFGGSENSFNNVFCSKLVSNQQRIKNALKDVNGVVFSLRKSGKVMEVKYDLDEKDLYNSYIKNLVKACEEFCENEELIAVINECFEEAYIEAFGKKPVGQRQKHLKKKGD